ncbi:guanine permease, partial [Achromatium sp. WMS3]
MVFIESRGLTMEKYFQLNAYGTNVKSEIIGGITTFLTMAYIIFVNPSILETTGMERQALITATCLAAAFGTILIGLSAKVPFAMAPGMGLNAFFAYTLVLGQGINWQTALGVVFLSGILFLILTIVGIQEKIVNAIPKELRIAVAVGIGLFIAMIGMKNLGLIIAHPHTLVTMGKLEPKVLLGLVGLITIIILEIKKVHGAILIGIIATTILGMSFGIVKIPTGFIAMPPPLTPIAFQLDIFAAFQWSLMGVIFSFMFVDLFDSVGTIVACSYEARLIQEDGSIRNINKMLQADAVATSIGALLGTSTTTTYIESAAGIADGARTGLAALCTAILFIAALFFTPLIEIVPAFATAPALIIVGVYMFKNVGAIDFRDFRIGFPAFLTIILMPLTFSIATGLTIGFLSYV